MGHTIIDRITRADYLRKTIVVACGLWMKTSKYCSGIVMMRIELVELHRTYWLFGEFRLAESNPNGVLMFVCAVLFLFHRNHVRIENENCNIALMNEVPVCEWWFNERQVTFWLTNVICLCKCFWTLFVECDKWVPEGDYRCDYTLQYDGRF